MRPVRLHRQAQIDLERLTDFLLASDAQAAEDTIELIQDALGILARHAGVGRRVGAGSLRELVIHRGRTGYLALYRLSHDEQEVEVLAIRHQRESGYHADDL